MMRMFLGLLMLLTSFTLLADDKLDMEGITIVGNSELPKALYIVPWQERDQQTSAGKPINSIIEEDIQPLNREVFLLRVGNGADGAGKSRL